jgi:multiple sugar transport system permease protein
VDWLSNPNFAIWAVIIVNVWTAIPFCGFVYLAALNSIPNHLYEAAKLDGAGAGQTFLYVTFPQILPTVQLLTVLVTIWGINSFDMIYTMTDGGPVNASETLVTYLYRLGFKLQNIGQANALSVTVFLVMLVLVVLYFKMRRINDEHA